MINTIFKGSLKAKTVTLAFKNTFFTVHLWTTASVKIYLQKNDLMITVIFCDVIGCFIGVYNLQLLLKSIIKTFSILNIRNLRELWTPGVIFAINR